MTRSGAVRQPSLNDAAPAAAREQFVRDREQQSVDEPVPMLGGLRPREAALDPIGRVDLERLLRQFEDRSDRGLAAQNQGSVPSCRLATRCLTSVDFRLAFTSA